MTLEKSLKTGHRFLEQAVVKKVSQIFVLIQNRFSGPFVVCLVWCRIGGRTVTFLSRCIKIAFSCLTNNVVFVVVVY